MTSMGSAADVRDARRREMLEGVSRALQAREMQEARRLAELAIADGLEHPLLFNLRAIGHEEAGRNEEALKDLRKAHFLAPNDFAVLNALGLACARTGRLAEAVGCYERALGIRADFAPAWFNRGWALERLGEVGQAAECYRKATELEPRHVEAWGGAAWLAARRGDVEGAKAAALRALELRPDCATATLALAAVEMDRPEDAEGRLRTLLERPTLDASERALALGELGDALDAQDQTHEAFESYRESNTVFRSIGAPMFAAPGQETAADALGWLIAWADALDPAAWPPGDSGPDAVGEARQHVFLMGFPRSGTTLIESMLAAHPDIVSLEERNTMHAAIRAFQAAPAGLRRLSAASARELKTYREDYWRSVRSYGVEPSGKIFIDKNPFNTLRLPLIWKLFPQARVIFAVRDPRDVVFSCFRRRFDLNPSTYELLDLERSARFYGGVMRLAEVLRPKQALAEHRLVYERLVGDFEGEARAVCAFLGAEWRDELMDFAGRGQRGGVASASAAQIARGLFKDGTGQWRRYRNELATVMPILTPWVERFGYPAD